MERLKSTRRAGRHQPPLNLLLDDKSGLHLFNNADGRTLTCKQSLLRYDTQRRRVKAEEEE